MRLSSIIGVLLAVAIAIAIFLYAAMGQAAPKATGLVFPPGWREAAAWDTSQPLTLDALPARWDWKDYGRLQPIRDQKSCGSCWAFATTAVTESLHRLIHPEVLPGLDLAEQTLVSTCERAGDCGGGYFTALDYIRDRGLPLEAADPYRATNSSCKAGLQPAAKITRWAYIGTRTAPTTAQLKAAIHDHGPIAVAVNGSFSGYRDGVYTRCGSTAQNHMVVLEGWVDDAAYARNGGGYWLMRNSWGTSWGEQGRMRIVYRSTAGGQCNGVGGVGAYAVMDGIEDLREHLHIPD